MTVLAILLAMMAGQPEQRVPVLEQIAIAGISGVLSNVLDAPCSVSRVKLDPEKQILELTGVKIGNPKHFDSDAAIQVGAVRVEADPKLLFGDTPEIRVMSLTDVVVNAEANRHGINLKKLMDTANSRVPAPLMQGDPNKRFKIHSAVLDKGVMNLVTSFLGKNSSQKNLERIEMSLMGQDGKGVTSSEAMSTVMSTLLDKSGLMKDGLGGLGELVIPGINL